MRQLILVIAVCSTLAACEKPTAKFHPGDKVFVKLSPDTKGVVAARISPFVDDLYYLKVPGDERVLYPRGEWDKWTGWDERPWHYEGPYCDTDLALTK
jgi:hypothetical protein